MLDQKDTDTVRQWLSQALLAAEKRGVSKADLARHCEVTPQAVNGWAKTGRIRKSHLEKAAAFLGYGPSFAGPTPAVHEAFSGWPFPRVSRLRFDALPAEERAKVEDFAVFVVTQWEEARLRAASGPAAA